MSAKLYAFERRFCAFAIAVMGGVVFGDVAHRFWTRREGLFARLFGTAPAGVVASQALGAALFCAVCFAALRTRGQTHGPRTWARAAAITVAAWVAMEVFVRLVPNGIVWSQTLALIVLLWIVCVGANLATHEHSHLALDLGSRLWPKRMLPFMHGLGDLIAAIFCLYLAALAAISVRNHLGDWRGTDGGAGVFVALAVPKWMAFSVMPLSFSVMAVRFFGQAIARVRQRDSA